MTIPIKDEETTLTPTQAPEVETAVKSPRELDLERQLAEIKLQLATASERDGNKLPAKDVSQLIADSVAEALKIAIPAAAVGINKAQSAATQNDREKMVRMANLRTQRCAICNLPESACGGPYELDADGLKIIKKDKDGNPLYTPTANHIRFVCAPKDEYLFKWFQGVIIRGVRFLSDYPNHAIWIPIKSDIPTMINAWERNEKELSQRRQAEGQGAGAVGPNGERMHGGNNNAIGWR